MAMHSPRRGGLTELEWILTIVLLGVGWMWKKDRDLIEWAANLAERSTYIAEVCAARYMSTTDSLGAEIRERFHEPEDTTSWLGSAGF